MTRLLALLLLLPTPAAAQYATAGNLHAACVSTTEIEQAVCQSFITGVADAVILTGVLGCEPEDYDAAAIRSAAIAELAKPERADQTAMAAVFDAVAATFPCRPLDEKP